MYKIYKIMDTIRIPPQNFSMKRDDVIKMVVREKYERKMDRDIGLILCADKIKSEEIGKVISGDGAAYFDVEFNALCFIPNINEIYKAKVKKIVDFGAFLSIGPIEGLVHISQITNDKMIYNKKNECFENKTKKRTLKIGDSCLVKVSTISLKETTADTKIGLTMRPFGLGKEEWVEQEKKKVKKNEGKK